MSDVILRPARLAEILPLRHAVLRAGLPLCSAQFSGDEDPSSKHLAAFSRRDADQEEAVACLSRMSSVWGSAGAQSAEPAWQLRGMAVAPGFQSRGLGRRLMMFALPQVRDRPLWCNARTGAVGFYEQFGFVIVSEVFEVPTVGPHRRMLLSDPGAWLDQLSDGSGEGRPG